MNNNDNKINDEIYDSDTEDKVFNTAEGDNISGNGLNENYNIAGDNDKPYSGLSSDKDEDSTENISDSEENTEDNIILLSESDFDQNETVEIDDNAESEDDEESSLNPKKKVSWKERTLKERFITLIPTVIIFAIFIIAEWQMEIGAVYTNEFKLSLLLVALSVIIGVFCVRLGRVWGWIVTALTPAASFLLTEYFTHNPIEDMTKSVIGVNLIFFYGTAVLVLFLTGSMKASIAVTAGVPMIFGITNYFVLQFRGTPFFPWDIASASTAASVADNYDFVISWHLCFIICAFLFIIQLGFLCTPRIRLKLWWLRAPMAIIAVVALVMTGSYVQSDEGVKELKLYPYLFSPKKVYNDNGAAITFAYTLQYTGLEKPSGYSANNLEEMLSEYESEPITGDEELPNVIVIMNEAFSDLKTAVNYKQNKPVTPYIDSMNDDTVKGTLHVSVKGGNTANSEFEFLTGISMANMTPGSIPYQQHIKGETPSIVTQFKELGYKTVGMHPYYATGWNRDKVYEWFGFDETYFRDHFKNTKGYETIRGYFSDASTYKKIIDLYENKDEGEPLFVFDVTMQNHGGYAKVESFKPETYVSGVATAGYVNTYLSLINKSDESFGELVEYFKNQDEPTVILMFGDHQPHDVYIKTLLDLYNVQIETGSIDEQLLRYTVPFVMWANYDIEEETDVHTSINYLSSMLCEKAGIPRTSTQMYLSALSEKYPVITEGLFCDAAGEYHSASEMDSITDFNKYEMLSYNMIADTRRTLESIYSYK